MLAVGNLLPTTKQGHQYAHWEVQITNTGMVRIGNLLRWAPGSQVTENGCSILNKKWINEALCLDCRPFLNNVNGMSIFSASQHKKNVEKKFFSYDTAVNGVGYCVILIHTCSD